MSSWRGRGRGVAVRAGVAAAAAALWCGLLGLQAAAAQPAAAGPACLDPRGRPVDWWVALKAPKSYALGYVDSNTLALGGAAWALGLSVLDAGGPVRATLAALVQPEGTSGGGPGGAGAGGLPPASQAAPALAHVLYNDADPPGTEWWLAAHAKGVAAFGGGRGFWLVHSAPRWPRPPSEGAKFSHLLPAQSVFGQHFLCLTLDGAGLEAAAQLLLAADPHVYASALPAALAAAHPAWARLLAAPLNGSAVPMVRQAALATAGGQAVRGFAKSGALDALIHDDVVGPALGVPMAWETWRRSHDALPSGCGPRANSTALNVASVAFGQAAHGSGGGGGRRGGGFGWASIDDHSKWGVSLGGGGGRGGGGGGNASTYVCLGDMNRATWQRRRGGGFVCLPHAGLWAAFHGLLAGLNGCALPTSGLSDGPPGASAAAV